MNNTTEEEAIEKEDEFFGNMVHLKLKGTPEEEILQKVREFWWAKCKDPHHEWAGTAVEAAVSEFMEDIFSAAEDYEAQQKEWGRI